MASSPPDALPPGAARSDGDSYSDILDRDQVPAPAVLRDESYEFLGDEPIPTEHYTSQSFFKLEAERLWPRVWQMACREEDIPRVGDCVLYEILDWSLIVMRASETEIKAYYNSCLHRGRKLRTSGGSVRQLRCPFHGFTWNVDGSFKEGPCPWDFPHVDPAQTALPEARVDTWGGFVFINMDDEAPELADFLGVLPAHFSRWRLEECAKVVHVGKVVPANWKATAEAFMESLHVEQTHPQIMPYSADVNARYDTYDEHVNRSVTPMAVTSPLLSDNPPAEQTILDALLETSGRINDAEADRLEVPEGMTARAFMAQISRAGFAAEDGRNYADTSDSEMLDAIVYNVFPNFSPWGGFVPNIVYRWRPNGWDVHSCLMEVMFLKRLPKGEAHPRPAPMRLLREDERWSDAAELGALGPIFDQDMGNLPHVQSGMRSSHSKKLLLANYQEVRIRHFHQTLEKYVR